MSEETTVTEKRTRNNYGVSQERFVEAAKEVSQANGTLDDLASKLGMPKNAVNARYTNYKKTRKDGTPGVALPKLRRKNNAKQLDVAKLNAILEEGTDNVSDTTRESGE